mmetsp:Transcript_20529/g.53580  ORF Transcript_20529/g.53580 Transcript_20529/m.53580 type:complete len:87 (+) Transcript_20529:2457-2717(+)
MSTRLQCGAVRATEEAGHLAACFQVCFQYRTFGSTVRSLCKYRPFMPPSQDRRIRMPTGGLCASFFVFVKDPFEQLQSFMAHDIGQ